MTGRGCRCRPSADPCRSRFCCARPSISSRCTLQFEFPRAPGRLGPDVWPQAILVLLMHHLRRRHRAATVPGRPSDAGSRDRRRARCRLGKVGRARSRRQKPEVPSRYGLVAGGFAALPGLSGGARIPGLPGRHVPADGALHAGRAVAQPARACWLSAPSAPWFCSISSAASSTCRCRWAAAPFHDWTVWVAQSPRHALSGRAIMVDVLLHLGQGLPDRSSTGQSDGLCASASCWACWSPCCRA